MKNPTLKILAVVSFIIFLFGGLSVYLAMQMKTYQKEATVAQEQIEQLKIELENCK